MFSKKLTWKLARLLSHDTKEQWLIVPQEFLHWLCSWEWLGDLRGPMRSPHQLLQLLKTKEWISVNYVFLKLSRPTVVCINAKCIHLSLSNVSKNSYIFRSFLTILPKNILLQEFKLFLYTKRETLLIQCYLIIFLPTVVQSSMTSIFKEIFYYATVPHFAQKANFSLLKIEFSLPV